MLTIGVLAIQGSIQEHIAALKEIGAIPIPVKTTEALTKVDGLILPGGESTTIGKLLKNFGLDTAIQKAAKHGMPLYGTCAGAILLARKIQGKHQSNTMRLADIVIARNAYGRQADSFTCFITVNHPLPSKKIPAIFIRAPKICSVGKNVTVISRHNGAIICALDGTILVSTFHPELTHDRTIHKFFLTLCKTYAEKKRPHRSTHTKAPYSIG